MDNEFEIKRAPSRFTGLEIEFRHEAIGWPRNVGQYDDIMENSYTNFSVKPMAASSRL